MEHDDRAQIEHLQRSVDQLASRVDELTQRIDALPSNQPPRVARPIASPASIPSPPPTQTPPVLKTNPSPTKSIPRDTKTTFPVSKSKPKFEIQFNPSKFEWLLGIKGLMLLGVVIVVIGVGMFLKLAHDEGWIGSLSPAIRCGSAAIFGVLLVGLGEVLRKKINPLASSGFSAAGIATMYASIYAASRMYNLFGPEVAFGLLALVSVCGVLLGALSNRILLALLSLVGAFLVPVLLATSEPSRVILPGYLLFLLTMGLVLSGWKGGHYSHARRLAWWGTGIIGTLWLGTTHDQSPASCLVFISLAWLMTIIELAVSSRFFGTLRDRIKWQSSCESGFITTESGEIKFNPLSLFTPEARWINSLFGATIWSVIAAGLTIKSLNPELVYLAPLGFGAASVLIILASMRIGLNPVASIASRTASPASLLISALLINASLLLVATIAIAFGGWIEVVAWLAVGLGAVETSRRFKFRAVCLFGLSLMSYSIARLLTFDLNQYHDSAPDFVLFGLAFTAWSMQVIVASITFAAATWRTRYDVERNTTASIALWLLAACMLHDSTIDSSHGAASLVIAALGCWLCVKVPVKALRINAFVLAGVSMTILCMSLVNKSFSDLPIDIRVIPMLIAALAWASIAALPKASYILRTTSATLVVLSGAITLGRIDHVYDTPTMLLAQAGYIGALLFLSKRLFAWSLVEIASTSAVILVSGWCIYMLGVDGDTLKLYPLMTINSYATIGMLAVVFYAARALITRALPQDAPEDLDLPTSRVWLSNLLLGMLWFFMLIASSIEIIRATNLFFDTDSALGAAISIWWSIYAVVSISLGFKLPRQLRWAGLTLLCLVGAKVLLLDTMTLAPAARIIASITVGLIIIATGVVYSRMVESLIKSDADNPDTPDASIPSNDQKHDGIPN